MIFFKKILSGEFGLVKAFWIYGILSSYALVIIFTGLVIYLNSKIINSVGSVLIMSYIFIQIIGVWNASNQYKGKLIWAFFLSYSLYCILFSLLETCTNCSLSDSLLCCGTLKTPHNLVDELNLVVNT